MGSREERSSLAQLPAGFPALFCKGETRVCRARGHRSFPLQTIGNLSLTSRRHCSEGFALSPTDDWEMKVWDPLSTWE